MTFSWYSITVNLSENDSQVFTGVFSVSTDNLMKEFYETINGKTDFNQNILVTDGGVPTGLVYENFIVYKINDIQYDNAYKNPWKQFDNFGPLITRMSYYPNFEFLNFACNNLGDELITNKGVIVSGKNDIFIDATFEINPIENPKPNTISWYNINISSQPGAEVFFKGYFSVNNNENIVKGFYETINGSTNFNDNLIVTNGLPSELTYEGYTVYTRNNIQYDNAYESGWLQFDYFGALIKKMSYYPNYEILNLCSNNLGDELITNKGDIVTGNNDIFIEAFFEITPTIDPTSITVATVNWYGEVKSIEQSTGISKTATYSGSASGSGVDYTSAVTVANDVASENATAISLSYYTDGYDTTHTLTYNTIVQNYYSIEIDGVTRNYVLINIDPNDVSNIKNVLLCFPGGGETNTTFIDYTSFNYIGSPVIVFLGQTSINTYTWQNAFVWLYNNFNQDGVTITYQNDVKFVDTVLLNLFKNNTPELFLTGKSDGGGFCVLYSNISIYKQNIKAIGICSSAHFGLNSIENIDSFDIKKCFIGNNNTVVPYDIILPPPNISLFIMHGTGDTIMPYYGQNCPGENNWYPFFFPEPTFEGSLWPVIDPTVKNNNGVITDNTYTVSFPSYIEEIVKTNNLTQSYSSSTSDYSYSVYSSKNNKVLNFITINNQDHDWSGHYNSGPNSNEPSNFTMDATYLLTQFFKLEIGNYIPTVEVIPSNLLNYKNEIIDE